RERFLREARLAASVTHPNLVEIYGVEEWMGIPYFVMPLLDCSLSQYVERHPLDIATVLRFSCQLAEGLKAAHSVSLIHRDLKPSNVLVREDSGEVVISDFGLARVVDDQAATQTGGLAGTPLFMSPEQARGETADRRSDMFSLGSVRYWMISGTAPFAGEKSYGTLRRIVESPHKSVETHNPNCPDWLSRLVDILLEKDPTQRTLDAGRLTDVLRRCQEHWESPSVVVLPAELAATNQPAWQKWAAAVMAAGAAVLVLAFSTNLFRPSVGDVDGIRSDTAQAEANTPIQQDLEADQSANTLEAQQQPAFSMQDRVGPLDALDWENLKADLKEEKRERYWLGRLAANLESEIPQEYVHVVERYLRSDETELKELAEQILLKNPFEEVATEVGADDENPFQEVESNDGF
ncbi:MAG: serine/threonine-protein kinase, partial [Planctomycetota bacterium]